NILIVDDDKNFRAGVAQELAARGHSLVETSRCGDAERALAAGTTDLIIVDGLLPDGDGVDWAVRLKQRDAATPVIVVTAFRKDDARLAKLPVNSVLRKPVTGRELAAKVENALRPVVPICELPPEAATQLAELRAAYERELPGFIDGLHKAI